MISIDVAERPQKEFTAYSCGMAPSKIDTNKSELDSSMAVFVIDIR